MSLDCRGVNPNGPGRFRTKADKPDQQAWYFKVNNKEQLYNVYINKIKDNKETNPGDIDFDIKEVKSMLQNNNETFDAKTELNNLIQNGSRNVRLNRGKNKIFAEIFQQ